MNGVVHFEIPFENQERATKFYKELFGWQISAVEGMPYWMCTTTPTDEKMMPKQPGAINGGMYERGKEGSRSPVIVIEVPDVEHHVADVKAAGGATVLTPRKVGEMGIYAQVKDTEGNIIGLWQVLAH